MQLGIRVFACCEQGLISRYFHQNNWVSCLACTVFVCQRIKTYFLHIICHRFLLLIILMEKFVSNLKRWMNFISHLLFALEWLFCLQFFTRIIPWRKITLPKFNGEKNSENNAHFVEEKKEERMRMRKKKKKKKYFEFSNNLKAAAIGCC